jgi:hypothetical protein
VRGALTLTLTGVALSLAACGGTASPVDAGPPDVACAEDAPAADAVEVGGALPFCGGVIGLVGETPFGLFAPDAVAATIEPGPTLRVTLAQDPPSGIQLTFDVVADSTGSLVGVFDLTAFLEQSAQVVPVALRVDVTSATDPFLPDGGHPDGGEATMQIAVTAACDAFGGTLAGTVVARYCSWD